MVLVHPFRDVRTSAYLFVLAFLHTCKMATPIPGINIRKKRWLVPLVMILISRKLKSFQQMSVTSVQPLSRVWLFATPWIAAYQASLSITNSWNLPKPMSIKSMMAPIISSSVVPFSSWPQSLPVSGSFQMSQLFSWGGHWSFSFNISPSSEHPGLISFKMNWLDLSRCTINFYHPSWSQARETGKFNCSVRDLGLTRLAWINFMSMGILLPGVAY